MCSWMATATPADTTIAARMQSSSTSIVVSRFSRALKKSRFQMLSQSAMPTLTTPNTTMPAVSVQATADSRARSSSRTATAANARSELCGVSNQSRKPGSIRSSFRSSAGQSITPNGRRTCGWKFM